MRGGAFHFSAQMYPDVPADTAADANVPEQWRQLTSIKCPIKSSGQPSHTIARTSLHGIAVKMSAVQTAQCVAQGLPSSDRDGGGGEVKRAAG